MYFRQTGELTYSADQTAVGVRHFLNERSRVEAPQEPRENPAVKADVTLVFGDQPVTVLCRGACAFNNREWRKAAIESLLAMIRMHKTDAEILGVEIV